MSAYVSGTARGGGVDELLGDTLPLNVFRA